MLSGEGTSPVMLTSLSLLLKEDGILDNMFVVELPKMLVYGDREESHGRSEVIKYKSQSDYFCGVCLL